MNSIERITDKAALKACDFMDTWKNLTGTWLDFHHGIDFQYNTMFIDTTGKTKDRGYLRSIAEAQFSNTIITGFIKTSNGHNRLLVPVLVIEGNGCNQQDMDEFCKQLPEIEEWFNNTIDEYEEKYGAFKVVPSSFWNSKTEPVFA